MTASPARNPRLTSDTAAAAPATLGRWLVLEEIGRGGHGIVYRALDTLIGREVALKTSADGNPDRGRARLRHEAELLARVSDPNVVTLYDLLQRADGMTLSMELVDGPALDSLVRARLTAAEIAAIGRQLASGVQALHRAGIVHGDIKPSNVRLSSNGVLKILDLGIGRDTEEIDDCRALTRPMSSGTRAYMAPELRAGQGPGVLSDVWSIGAVLFELATGKRWCDERRLDESSSATQRPAIRVSRQLGYRPDERSVRRRELRGSQTLTDIIECALATSPEARFQSAKTLADALTRATLSTRPVSRKNVGSPTGRSGAERHITRSRDHCRGRTDRGYRRDVIPGGTRFQQAGLSLSADATAL